MEKLFAMCYTICKHKIRCCVCSVPRKKLVLHCFQEQAGSKTAIYNILLPMFVIAATQLQDHFKQLPFSLAPSVPVSNTLITQQIVFFFGIFHVESCLVTETPCKIISSWNYHFHSPLPDLDSNLPTLCTCVVFCFSCFLSLPKWFIILVHFKRAIKAISAQGGRTHLARDIKALNEANHYFRKPRKKQMRQNATF